MPPYPTPTYGMPPSTGLNDFTPSALGMLPANDVMSPQLGYAPAPAVIPSALTAQGLASFNGLKTGFDYNAPVLGGSGGGVPGLGGGGGGQQQQQGMTTAGYVNAGLAGLQTLGNLWMGFKQMKLANKSFKFSKDMAETNLANQMKAYNTNLADRARSRGFTEGQSQSQIDQYVADNRATRSH